MCIRLSVESSGPTRSKCRRNDDGVQSRSLGQEVPMGHICRSSLIRGVNGGVRGVAVYSPV